jgi:hypothetical protein
MQGASGVVELTGRLHAWMRRSKRCRRCAPNVLLLGPPGAGTSRLARRLTPILPAMSSPEALATTRLPRVAGRTGARPALVTTRPCRAPPRTIAEAGLSGGGPVALSGEGSRAHPDILWLAEQPERSAMSSRSGDHRSRRVSSTEHGAPITAVVALAALAARRQATTPAHTSRCMALRTAHRSAARTTPLLTACPCGTIIASLSDGGVAHVMVPLLLT